MQKVCTKCKKLKAETDFNFRNKAKGTFQSRCKNCTRKDIQRHYEENKKYYLNKTKLRNEEVRKNTQNFILRYLRDNPCVDCGESDLIVLEFDHIGNKNYSISYLLGARYGLNKLKQEIKKCVVRCANCHRRKTAKDFNWYKNS